MRRANIDVRAHRVQVKRNLPRRVRAVDNGKYAGSARSPANGLNREPQSRGAGDVADKDDSGVLIHTALNTLRVRHAAAARDFVPFKPRLAS